MRALTSLFGIPGNRGVRGAMPLLAICALAPAAYAMQLTGSTGNGQSFTNLQPSLAINYFLPLTGIYPDRNGFAGEMTLGSVRMFAGTFTPGGAAAEGNLLPIADHSALFSLLGTSYGGNGRTNFALPDLRGRAAVHAGTGPGLTNRRLGQKFGAESVTPKR